MGTPESKDGQNDVSRLFDAMVTGRSEAATELLTLVYDDLRRVASSLLAGEAHGHTLQPTALVHEAYLRLAAQRSGKWDDRVQFIGIAAGIMRRVLVDHARGKKAEKRGGGVAKIQVTDTVAAFERSEVDLLSLDEALVELSELDAAKAQLIELRFFGGLEVQHAATLLGIPLRTAERDWTFAKAWLRDRMSKE